MNFTQIREINEKILKNLNEYKQTGDKSKYQTAAYLNYKLIEYSKFFQVSAIDLINAVETKLAEEQKTSSKSFVRFITHDSTKINEFDDPFHKMQMAEFEFSLQIANTETKQTFIIIKDKYSVVSSNKDDLVFDTDYANDCLNRKMVDLLKPINPIYIANFNNPNDCYLSTKYNIEDTLWGVVEENVGKIIAKNIQNLTNERDVLTQKIDTLEKDKNLDDLVKL